MVRLRQRWAEPARSAHGPVAAAIVCGVALYLVGGLPFVLYLLWSGASPSIGKDDSIFLVIPYWTGGSHILAVVGFGLTLLVAGVIVRPLSTRAALAAIGLAVAVYVTVPLVLTYADDVTLPLIFSVFPFFSGWVALACGAAWWRLVRTWPRRGGTSGART